MPETPNPKTPPKAGKADAEKPPARKRHKLFMIRPVELAGKIIKKGEVLAEIEVHADSNVHHAIGVMRNGLVSLEEPAPDPEETKG